MVQKMGIQVLINYLWGCRWGPKISMNIVFLIEAHIITTSIINYYLPWYHWRQGPSFWQGPLSGESGDLLESYPFPRPQDGAFDGVFVWHHQEFFYLKCLLFFLTKWIGNFYNWTLLNAISWILWNRIG